MILVLRQRFSKSSYWKDVVWQASGNSLAQAIGILVMPALTRLYTPHDFATLNLFMQVVGFTAIIMTWRYEYLILLPKDDVDSRDLSYVILLLGFIGLIVTTPLMMVFKADLSNWLNEPSLEYWLVLAPITAMLMSFSLVFQHQVQRRQNYRKSGVSELINKSGYVVSGLLGYWLLPGATGLIVASAIGASGKIAWLIEPWNKLKLVYAGVIGHKKDGLITQKIVNMGRVARIYFRMTSSLAFSHIMLAFTGGIPAIFIAKVYGSEILGQFMLVISTLYLPSSLIGRAIGQVYYQRAADQWAQEKNFVDLWYSTAKKLLCIAVPFYTIVAILSPWAYPFVFGQDWRSAGQLAVPMTVSAFLSFITSPLDRACLVVNAWWYVPIWHTVRAISTGLIAWLAWINVWDFQVFLVVLIIQMSVMYLIDYWAEWCFASRSPGC